MPESLATLEEERRSLLHQLSQLRDFRPGSITATRGRCGNPRCHCHRPGSRRSFGPADFNTVCASGALT